MVSTFVMPLKPKGRFVMISDKMTKKLNEQIVAEFAASHSYLAMACALDRMGLKILAKFFTRQSEEEREHGLKIVGYMQEVDAEVRLGGCPEPKVDYDGAEEVVEAALESERKVTRMIHDLVALAEKEDDYATRSFLNWFIDEQVEEVATMTDLLNIVRLAGDNMLQVESRVRHEMLSKD